MSIEVVTIANKAPDHATYYTWGAFHASLAEFGFQARVLGYGQPWYGLMTKLRKLQEWLRTGECQSDIIAVCDSWDSVWQKSPAQMDAQFRDLGAKMVIGVERNCFPNPKNSKLHPECASSFRYINTGLILATPLRLLRFLNAMNLSDIPNDGEDPDNPSPNDQHYVMEAFLNGDRDGIVLDTETQYVVNLCEVKKEELEWDTPQITIKETGNAPFLLHLNGGAKTSGLREMILKKFNLPEN